MSFSVTAIAIIQDEYTKLYTKSSNKIGNYMIIDI